MTQSSPAPENLNFNGLLIGGGTPLNSESNWPRRLSILEAGIDMAVPEKPSVLVIPSARTKSQETFDKAVDGFVGYYERRGLKADSLHSYAYVKDETGKHLDASLLPSSDELSDKIEAADLVFVLGGDPNRAINEIWRPLGVDEMLKKAAENKTVISGTSTGALAWFEGTLSDGDSLKNDDNAEHEFDGFHYIKTLGWLAATLCGPHFDQSVKGRSRENAFEAMMAARQSHGELGIGIDNGAAIRILGGQTLQAMTFGNKSRQVVHALRYRDGVRHMDQIAPMDGPITFDSLRP